MKQNVATLKISGIRSKIKASDRWFLKHAKTAFVNVKHFIIETQCFLMNTFGELISENSNLSLHMGSKEHNDCTIHKYYPRLYYVNEETKECKFVKAKYMELQYSKGKSLILSNEDVLVFKDLSYLRMEGIHDNSSEVIELSTFNSLNESKSNILARMSHHKFLICLDLLSFRKTKH